MSDWAANLIRLARRQSRLSQRELARRSGTSQAAIAAYESARRQPTLETLARIVRAAGQDLRIRLEPYDDHDDWLARYEAGLPPGAVEERRRMDAELVRLARREAAVRQRRSQTKSAR
jgi:transcriptional regulator with XRE-family HTH domain